MYYQHLNKFTLKFALKTDLQIWKYTKIKRWISEINNDSHEKQFYFKSTVVKAKMMIVITCNLELGMTE